MCRDGMPGRLERLATSLVGFERGLYDAYSVQSAPSIIVLALTDPGLLYGIRD